MNNGEKRNTEEKKQFRKFAINSGLNPYNLLCPTGKADRFRQKRKQFINGKVITHFI